MEKNYNYKLFPNKEDQDKFYKILAELYLERSEKQRQELSAELEKLQESCGQILSAHGTSENLVKQIIDTNAEINDSSTVRSEEETARLKDARSELYSKLLDAVHSLEANHETLSIGEDLERDANKAFDRQEKTISIKRGEEEVKGTITGEPISHEEMLSAYPFKQIREFKGLTIEEKAETQEELVSKPKQEEIVTGISEAPESLLDKVYPKVEEPTEEEIAESPVLTDNSFFATDDELKEAIEQTPETPIEDIKEEPDGDEPDGLALLDEIAKEKENSQEPKTKDIVIPEDDEKTLPELNDDNSLTYELTSGVSLSDVAESAYYDKGTWNKLYSFNKKSIDEKLNGVPIETVKDDKNILTGLVIRVPFTLDITSPKKVEAKKVA
ncbi:unknown [Clostridium sp. CAG:533]|nr:unknown [Clostridium sp. CAG:533]